MVSRYPLHLAKNYHIIIFRFRSPLKVSLSHVPSINNMVFQALIFYSNVALNPLICLTLDVRLRSILLNMLLTKTSFNKSHTNYLNPQKKPKHDIFAMTLTTPCRSAIVSPSVSHTSINSTQRWLDSNFVVMPPLHLTSPKLTPHAVEKKKLCLSSSSSEMMSTCSTEVSEV